MTSAVMMMNTMGKERVMSNFHIYGELEMHWDGDGIWLVDIGSKHGTLQLGHVPWKIVATFIKEYL
jgi:acetylornithine/succinyldiaminopimelate/putrescine aminotransferase